MPRTRPAIVVVAALSVLTLSARVAPTPGVDWPSFRGIGASGVAEGRETPTTFSPQTAAWKTPLAGLGLSSPVVWGNVLCVSTALGGQKDAGLKVGLYGNIEPVADDTAHEWKIICFDKRDGKVAWERTAYRASRE